MMTQGEFLAWSHSSHKKVAFELAYVDAAGGDLIAGLLLSEIVYWHLPSAEGKTKLRVKHEGHLWIAARREDWYERCRISPRQFDRAAATLVTEGLIVKDVFKFNGDPTIHVRLNWSGFLTRISETVKRNFDIAETAITNSTFGEGPVTKHTTETTTSIVGPSPHAGGKVETANGASENILTAPLEHPEDIPARTAYEQAETDAHRSGNDSMDQPLPGDNLTGNQNGSEKSAQADNSAGNISRAEKKAKARNPLFDALAECVFSLKGDVDMAAGPRIGKLEKFVKGQGGTAQDVNAFCRWFKGKFPGVSVPRDLTKFAEHWSAFTATRTVPLALASAPAVDVVAARDAALSGMAASETGFLFGSVDSAYTDLPAIQ
jgi:hypothetical protein